MRVLIAEDDAVSRMVLEAALTKWGHEVVVTTDGEAAWETLKRDDAPRLAVLDVMMPGLDGIEICRRLREQTSMTPVYVILLTAMAAKGDIVRGLDAGANDYVTKPFDHDELRARVRVGATVVELQRSLAERVNELVLAVSQVKRLEGILPICSYCKHVRDDGNYWQQVETYISEHSDARFSHSICPGCYENVVRPSLAQAAGRRERQG